MYMNTHINIYVDIYMLSFSFIFDSVTKIYHQNTKQCQQKSAKGKSCSILIFLKYIVISDISLVKGNVLFL